MQIDFFFATLHTKITQEFNKQSNSGKKKKNASDRVLNTPLRNSLR